VCVLLIASDNCSHALHAYTQAESTTREEKEKESPGASEADVDEESDTDEGETQEDHTLNPEP
jgi:hypothetical protein